MSERRTIQRVGFRKWYERELLRSHGHLVLLVLCALGLLGSLELLSEGASRNPWLAAACALVSAGIGLWALRRYLHHLGHAQYVAYQAVCPACRTYARWDIEDEAAAAQHASSERLRVRCRGCTHVWDIRLQ